MSNSQPGSVYASNTSKSEPVPMTEDLRLSVSKVKTFNQCRKQFEFSYILKMPKKLHSYHTVGSFCHMVLEYFHQQYIDGSTAPYNTTMTEAFKVAWTEYKDRMTSEMKKECWGMVDQYLRLITKEKQNGSSAKVLAVEKRFELQLTPNLVLNGAIDRVQLDADNVLHLADYKTTKNKKYLKNDWFQLLTYSFIKLEENPSLEKIRASYILLRHDFEYITTEFSKKQILEVKDKYLDYAKQILSETEYPATPTNLCNWCDFQEHCSEGQTKMFSKVKADNKTFGEIAW